MNRLTLAACACAAMTVTSCQMVQQTAQTTDIDAKVVQVPTVADLEVKPQRIEATQSWNWKFFGTDGIPQRKKNLIYDMVAQAKADVLVEPQVRLTKKMFGERTLTISGYPATYKNFRKPTEDDLKALRTANGIPEKVVVVGDSAHIAAPSEGAAVVAPVKGKKRAYTEDALFAPSQKAKQKTRFYIKGAASFNTVKSAEERINDRYSISSQIGYDSSFGIQKFIKKSSFYYAPELGLTSHGCKIEEKDSYYDSSEGGLSHAVYISPINFGYQYNINKAFAIDAHIGFPVSYDYMEDCNPLRYYDSYYRDYNEATQWDVAMKLGVGVWIKNFNIEFNYKRGFVETYGYSKAQALTLGIGVRF